MRIEDLDRPRVRPGVAQHILTDLAWLGLDWDEGPDVGGPHAPYEQWLRRERYDSAFGRLLAAGRVYPCFCSRRDVAAAASAPQTGGDETVYPGTCRSIDPDEARRRITAWYARSWRFRVDPAESPVFDDRVLGSPPHEPCAAPGDFVVRRADGVPAYQLAVVVDDAEMEIDEVVRGDDLVPSTTRQLLLFQALELPPPVFGHVPLLLGPDGIRLSKRHEGTSIRELRELGFPAETIVGRLAHLAGLRPDPRSVAAVDLVAGFSLDIVKPARAGIVVDTRDWR